MSLFESPPEEIGTYASSHIPTTPVEVVPVRREGHSMFDMIVKTDPITACEMRAFVKGFFTAFNNRERLG